ncbi:DUF5034 domain-containing protein [Flavobacterium sp. JP2137]|uniref:DUF5034 domain-containing protein n=1 Tax=Flavobacterium sp. JP2137 TaxID=3414510 RepID=UPI003D2FEF42
MKKGVYLTILLVLWGSCKQDDEIYPGPFSGPKNEKSYIDYFTHVSGIQATVFSGVLVDEAQQLFFYLKRDTSQNYKDLKEGISVLVQSDSRCSVGFSWFSDNPGFYKYANLIGDTLYNSSKRPPWSNAIIDTLQSIQIMTDQDFDQQHPKGSDVSKYFKVFFSNPYLVVKNHYQIYTGEYAYRLEDAINEAPYAILGRSLEETDFRSYPFMNDSWICVLTTAPEADGAYRFTVKVIKKNGDLLTAQTKQSIHIKGR